METEFDIKFEVVLEQLDYYYYYYGGLIHVVKDKHDKNMRTTQNPLPHCYIISWFCCQC